MKLKEISISNFRGYKEKTSIKFGDLTAFVGKNDSGKSTVLEALDIFFNDGKGIVKIDKEDVNKECRNNENLETIISVSFCDLPSEINIDVSNSTSLKNEYLLNSNGDFEITKRYKDGGKAKIYVKAYHPTNPKCDGLLQKKNASLKEIVDELNLSCNKTKNAEMRSAIWNYYADNLQLKEVELDVDTKEGELKSIWEKIQTYLPVYSLFQSDRRNSDSDDEVQDPLKEAVKQIVKESQIQEELNKITLEVKNKLEEVANLTLSKLREMNPEIANSLHPVLPSAKLEDLFKGVSISGDEDIPINKRGSGVKRLVLLNFFRAQSERKQESSESSGIIYAIEEPETSQHINHQLILMNSFVKLSKQQNIQIIVTTHSANIVKCLSFSNLRIIEKTEKGIEINPVERRILPHPSLNEINYLVFDGESAIEYHNELYGYLQEKASTENEQCWREKEFDKWLNNKGVQFTKQWIKVEKGNSAEPYPCTLPTYIRNSIHHPENNNNEIYSNDELRESIEVLMEISINAMA